MKPFLPKLEKPGMKFRLLLVFGIILLVTMFSATMAIQYNSRQLIKELLEQSNVQKTRELNNELNGLYERINQIFITINSGRSYEMFENKVGLTGFEKVKRQLSYEQDIKEVINGNNMQSAVTGMIFYIDDNRKAYIGNGTIDKAYQIKDTQWYKKFRESGSTKLIYGPVQEEFRPKSSVKNEVLYYVRAWNVPAGSGVRGEEVPFILFCISMDYMESIFANYAEGSGGYLVTDETGKMLASYYLEAPERIWQLIGEQSKTFRETGTYMNQEWFLSRSERNKLGFSIYSVTSTEEMFHEMNRTIRNVNIIILVTGMAAFGLTIALSSRIMMPMKLLNQLISTIEEENDTFILVQSNDEIGQIGSRFNQMKKKLQEMSANMYLTRVQEKEAQLSALQSQINPHFLYNTLDNIYCIAQIEEVDSIVHLSEDLSKMMRYSMDMKKRFVPVRMELDHVRAYVNIINIRFDDSIQLSLCIPESVMDTQLLKLMLQPLVENAWHHGLLPKPGHKGIIGIEMQVKGDTLLATVTDDGVGISKERSEEMNGLLKSIDYEISDSATGFGIALKNVNNRIKLSYGMEYGITLSPGEEGGCRAMMKVKIKNANDDQV